MQEENTSPGDAPKENEIADYFEGVKKLEMEGYETGIKKARNALYVTAALLLLGELLTAGLAGIPFTPLLIGIALFESGIFVVLALWTKTKPYSAIIVGLLLFILLWVLSVVLIGGKAVYSGIIVKVIIIYFLINALKPAKAWEDSKKTI